MSAVAQASDEPIVRIDGVERHFRTRRGTVQAVNGVDLQIRPGEALALVGESGSGKSTLGRIVLGLDRPTAGHVALWGKEVQSYRKSELTLLRRRLGAVFQNPGGSLNPRMSVGRIIAEPLVVHRYGSSTARHERVHELLDAVGLNASYARRRASSLSGGQQQRVAIARSLALEPELMVLDEAVSALDVSVQAQVMTLLENLRQRYRFAMLFITHDLGVVRQVADRVAVMYLGRIVELGETDEVLSSSRHPYTLALLSSAMDLDDHDESERILLTGDPPSPISPPSGCVFRTRCFRAQDKCAAERPDLQTRDSHDAACWFPGPIGSWPPDADLKQARLRPIDMSVGTHI
jgi:oligopeptide/dipeptide ABC transporter ATP-binding protein